VDAGQPAVEPVAAPATSPDNDRLTALADEVAALRAELNQLKQQLGVAPADNSKEAPPADHA
jgi:hypothetical protein